MFKNKISLNFLVILFVLGTVSMAMGQTLHNPALKGLYADPEILFAKKTGQFYIYPTSDGFSNWSGTYFKAFSSADLVNWKDEGVILDLAKDVAWAKVETIV